MWSCLAATSDSTPDSLSQSHLIVRRIISDPINRAARQRVSGFNHFSPEIRRMQAVVRGCGRSLATGATRHNRQCGAHVDSTKNLAVARISCTVLPLQHKRHYASSTQRRTSTRRPCPFGLLLDIDGVLCRGKETLPGALSTFKYFSDNDRQMTVPLVFVTNAGNTLRQNKAEKLSDMLDVRINADQVVMSHSPLKMFTQFHDMHVLAVGQGPIMDIARNVGFSRVTTLDNLRSLFPHLDCVDYRRRAHVDIKSNHPYHFPAIVLFGEPLNWESAMQLIMDVLLTDGRLSEAAAARAGRVPQPHLPLLGCNMDMLWMAETTPLPRIGHGTFLLCIETLYRKLTGHTLHYTALLGKPSEITYHHAAYCIHKEARRLGYPPPKTIYAIGDNVESDILGANLFDRELQLNRASRPPHHVARAITQHVQRQTVAQAGSSATRTFDRADVFALDELGNVEDGSADGDDDVGGQSDGEDGVYGVRKCYSILVETGVYSKDCRIVDSVAGGMSGSNESTGGDIRQPDFYESDVWSAARTVCDREGWTPPEK